MTSADAAAQNPTITKTKLTRCWACYGSGKIEAGGFVKKDCTHCNGSGNIATIEADIEVLLAKTTDRYQDAKKKIKNLSKGITNEEAERILDNALRTPEQKPDLQQPDERLTTHGTP